MNTRLLIKNGSFWKFIFMTVAIAILKSGYGQTIPLKEMLSQLKCEDFLCFNTFMTSQKFDSVKTSFDGTDVYHRFEGQQLVKDDGGSESKVIIHYAILKGGVFNSSISTFSTQYAIMLQEELRQLGFVEASDQEKTESRSWYRSPAYKADLMVEKLIRKDSNQKDKILWHIGLVWSKG